MTYGFDLEDDLRRRLRGPVPAPALAWVERVTGARVVEQQPLEGGRSAALHRLRLDRHRPPVVLQRFVLDWIVEEPWAPQNAATVLDLLQDTPVPAPQLLGADPTGAETGVPMVLMTALPGEVVWDPPDLDGWLGSIVATMNAIHRVPRPAGLRAWAPYPPEDVPPTWSSHRWAWERALDAYAGDRPEAEPVLIHRDFHPGNLLWTGGAVTGVVDWVSCCVGPAEEDVALCRTDLARHHGQQVADRFLELWLASVGRRDYHPYWDLVTAVSMGGEPSPALDEFVRCAAARRP